MKGRRFFLLIIVLLVVVLIFHEFSQLSNLSWECIKQRCKWDPDPFAYLTRPSACQSFPNCSGEHLGYGNCSGDLLAIVYIPVPVDIDGTLTKEIIRRTWADQLAKKGVRVIFVHGIDEKSDEHNKQILFEDSVHRDILLVNFTDEWQHLINKWWATMHFHASYCSNVPFMVFTDMDTVIFGDRFVSFLKMHNRWYEDDLGCVILNWQPTDRDPTSRYFVSERQWPHKRLPKYCSGSLELLSTKTARALSLGVRQLGSEFVLSFHIFDVVTGLVANKAGVQLRQLPRLYPWIPVEDICDAIAVHGLKPALLIPDFLEYERRCCSIKAKKCPFNGTVPRYNGQDHRFG